MLSLYEYQVLRFGSCFGDLKLESRRLGATTRVSVPTRFDSWIFKLFPVLSSNNRRRRFRDQRRLKV
ncbi:unnamed protein product [Brassica oleracea var. botrytis]|uniref:(rape) hypothetical protein n=1 Tax=Brassica napus TaxID=3708 RepID=A0A816KHW5_BRANA|nr:unnamed protein product [Brassica napus]